MKKERYIIVRTIDGESYAFSSREYQMNLNYEEYLVEIIQYELGKANHVAYIFPFCNIGFAGETESIAPFSNTSEKRAWMSISEGYIPPAFSMIQLMTRTRKILMGAYIEDGVISPEGLFPSNAALPAFFEKSFFGENGESLNLITEDVIAWRNVDVPEIL